MCDLPKNCFSRCTMHSHSERMKMNLMTKDNVFTLLVKAKEDSISDVKEVKEIVLKKTGAKSQSGKFLMVIHLKMIGMLFNVVHDQVQKTKRKKHI